jgi:hypothetical protein
MAARTCPQQCCTLPCYTFALCEVFCSNLRSCSSHTPVSHALQCRLLYEATHCGVMLAAVILLLTYLFALTPNIRLTTK